MLVEAFLLEVNPNFGHCMIVFTLGITFLGDEGISSHLPALADALSLGGVWAGSLTED